MTTVTNTDDKATVADIQRAVKSAFDLFVSADARKIMAKADAASAADAEIGTREKQLTRLAAAATAAEWSIDDTTIAVDAVVSELAGNDKRKKSSLATFRAEVMLVCRKGVREQVPTVFRLAREAFEREGAALAENDKAPKPLRRAFARQYHAAVGVLKTVRDQPGYTIGTVDAVIDTARQILDKRAAATLDAPRVLKRLTAITKELQAFAAEYPVDGILECLEYLPHVDAAELKKAVAARKTPAAPESEDVPDADEPEADDEPLDMEAELDAAVQATRAPVDTALDEIYGSARAA